MPLSADQPYRVGKGKPPEEHQWKKGQASPNPKGRPKGSTRQTQLQKLLKKKVWVTGPDGRAVRRTLQEIIDHKLVQTAAGGDLKAIELVSKLALMHERFSRSVQPSREELKRQMAEEEERERLNQKLVQNFAEQLDFMASLKKLGVVVFSNGKPCVPRWVLEAAAERQPNSGFAERLRRQKEREAGRSPDSVDKPIDQAR